MAIQLQFVLPVEGDDGVTPLEQEDEKEFVPPAAILLLQVLTVEARGEEVHDDSRS